MLTYLQHHVLLAQMAIGMLTAAFASLVLWIALRPEQDPYDAAHRSRRRAWRLRAHVPRHGERYMPRHEQDATGTAVVLGNTVDGDITLVHADWIGDEPTDATLEALLRREPIGAAA